MSLSAGSAHPLPASGGDLPAAPPVPRLRLDPLGLVLRNEVVVIIALSIPFFFVGLGLPAFSDPDEPYYAVPAAEMLRSGSWALPLFRGHPWFDKPILFYWMVLAGFRLLGPTELAARLGSALAAVAGVLSVRALGRRAGLGAAASMTGAVILATSLGYAVAARAAVTDMTLTVMITLGMLAAAGYLATGSRAAAGLAGAGFGLAALTKGPVGLLIPVLTLGSFGLLARRRDLLRPTAIVSAGAGFLLAAAPWYLYMTLAHPDLLFGRFLGEGNLGRFLVAEHSSFAFYYPVVLALGLLPWSGALPAAILASVRGARARRGDPREGCEAPLLLLCWLGSVLVVFSAAASKLPSYLLPAFPPAALLLGSYWSGRFGQPARPRPGAPALAVVGVLIVLTATLGMVWTASARGWWFVPPAAATAGAALALGILGAFVSLRRGSLVRFAGWHAGGSLLALAIAALWLVPQLEPYDSTRPLVRQLQALGQDGAVVGAFKVPDVSLDFYLGRSVARTREASELRRLAGASPGGIWVVRTSDLEALPVGGRFSIETVAGGPHRSAVRLSPRADGAGGEGG